MPDGKWHGVLDMVQSEHPCTNLLTYLAILDKQKWSHSSERVLLAPGWPVPEMSAQSESIGCVVSVVHTGILEDSPADCWELGERLLEGNSIQWD